MPPSERPALPTPESPPAPPDPAPPAASPRERVLLQPLAREFPNIEAAEAEIARLTAILTLPMGTIHVISDVQGEHRKLRHVINNASCTSPAGSCATSPSRSSSSRATAGIADRAATS
jgi:hypothetical protein